MKLIFYIKNKTNKRCNLSHRYLETQTPKMYLLMQRYSYGITKAVVQRCSVKELLLKISRNLQENTGAGVFF